MMAVLLALAPLLAFQAADVDVAVEPKLQSKVTISAKAEPVNEVLKRIGKEGNATVVASNNLWDLKVSAFCKDEPAGPMLDRIADVLGCKWVKDGELFRMEMPREVQQQRAAYEQAEARLMRQQIEKTLGDYVKLAGANKLVASAGPVPEGINPAAGREANNIAFGQMLASMPSAAYAGFWRGEIRTYVPMEVAATPGANTSPNAPRERPRPNEAKRIVAQFDPHLVSVERAPGTDNQLRHLTLLWYPRPPQSLAELPFAKAVNAWRADSKIPEDDPRFKSAVQPVTYNRDGYFSPKPTMADHVEAFFKSTKIPIVADAFSTVAYARSMTVDARSWLAQVPSGEAKVDKGIVGVRHNGFWRLRQFEIPENVTKSYEQLAEIEPLTLEHYTSFLGRLKPAQVSALGLEDGLVLGFDTQPFVRMTPALHFYATLSPEQRRQARSGLDAVSLSPAQKQAFAGAILAGILKGYGKPAYVGRMLEGDFSELGVVVAEESMESGVKDKRGKPIVGARKFHIYLGSRTDPIRYEAEAKGKRPREK